MVTALLCLWQSPWQPGEQLLPLLKGVILVMALGLPIFYLPLPCYVLLKTRICALFASFCYHQVLRFSLLDSMSIKKAEVMDVDVLHRANMHDVPQTLATGNRKLLVSSSERMMMVSAACFPRHLRIDRNSIKMVILSCFVTHI